MQNQSKELIKSTENLNRIESVEKFQTCKNSLVKYETKFSNEDRAEIIVQLGELSFCRAEEINDYEFEIWFKFLSEQGYAKNHILEMIDCGKRLPKFGKLAVGDIIKEWEDTIGSEYRLYYQFKREEKIKEQRKIREATKQRIENEQLLELESEFKSLHINK